MLRNILFFSDIDDTLMQTARKTDFDRPTVAGAKNKEGNDHSFFYEGTKRLIEALMASNITFIPTTARNLDSYRRTVFFADRRIDYAILNFGGTILHRGQIDNDWHEKMQASYARVEPLKDVYEALETTLQASGLQVVNKIIDGYYLSIYNKFALDDETVLTALSETLKAFLEDRKDFYLYENGNSFGILPHFLNKKFAAEELITRHDALLTIGAGDNLSDLQFMQLADFQLVPSGSFIDQKKLRQ